ncbi:MAG: FtsX-like permease family protein [Myxococcales bacterium]|nr:FtsX-like permease family protein [Myxococcales bacterium]
MIRTLRAGTYAVRRAIGGMARRPLVLALSVSAIGVALLLGGVVFLGARAVANVSSSWGGGVHMVVYLGDDVNPERAQAIAGAIEELDAVEEVTYISPADAFARLEQSLGGRRELLEGVEHGALPSSLEVSFAGGVRDVAGVSPFVDRLRKTPGVEDVELVSDWVDRLVFLLRSLRAGAIGLALLVSLAAIYLVSVTVRLALHARRDEIAILRLVGATERYVKGHVLFDGLVQGALGAGLAAGALHLLHGWIGPDLSATMSGILGTGSFAFFVPREIVALVALGATLGVVGSWLAIEKHVDA